MKDITLYTWRTCPYSKKAKELLDSLGYEYIDNDILDHPEIKEELTAKTGQSSVPYVFIGDELIGGSSDLQALVEAEKLEELLQED